MKTSNKIVCTCGAEYLPAEIFFPDKFLGNPGNVEKDVYHKIIFYPGENMDLSETYTCDKCNRKMNIRAKVQFTVSVEDFKQNYSTKIKKPALFLDEN